MSEYIINLFWDEEASVWGAINDDIPIALESESIDFLIERIQISVPEILSLNGKEDETPVLHLRIEKVVKGNCQ